LGLSLNLNNAFQWFSKTVPCEHLRKLEGKKKDPRRR